MITQINGVREDEENIELIDINAFGVFLCARLKRTAELLIREKAKIQQLNIYFLFKCMDAVYGARAIR